MYEWNKDSGAPYSRNVIVPAAKKGLELLDSGEALRAPALLLVAILAAQKGGGGKMAVMFIDAGFQSRGIVFENEMGYRRQFDVLGYTKEEREYYAFTVLRHEIVAVVLGGGQVEREKARRLGIPVIEIPRQALSSKLKVAIVTEDGEIQSWIEVHVDPTLVAEATTAPLNQ